MHTFTVIIFIYNYYLKAIIIINDNNFVFEKLLKINTFMIIHVIIIAE
jgi:hypothetical protein